jgi:predicted nucleic acid-binding protein
MEMTDAEPCFVDTNILLAATDRDRKDHRHSREIFERGFKGELRIFACGQILREYLVVTTRPLENNGMGMTPAKAVENVASFNKCVQLLNETDATTRRLTSLIEKHKLKGKRIHDANLVAIMIENGLRKLFTLNPADFKIFTSIQTDTP